MSTPAPAKLKQNLAKIKTSKQKAPTIVNQNFNHTQQMSSLKKQNLQQLIQIKKLIQRSTYMKMEQVSEKQRIFQFQTQIKQKLQKIQIRNSFMSQQLTEIITAKQLVQIQLGSYKYKFQKINQEYQQYQKQKQKQISQRQLDLSVTLMKYGSFYSDYHSAVSHRALYQQKNNELMKKVQSLQLQQIHFKADSDMQKIELTDYLKNQMNQRMNQMRLNLLKMKKQYSNTNQRLTFLQNQKLIEELDFIWKYSEQTINQNQLLKNQIKKIKNEKDILKQLIGQLIKSNYQKNKNKNKNQNNNNNKKQIKQNQQVKLNKKKQVSSLNCLQNLNQSQHQDKYVKINEIQPQKYELSKKQIKNKVLNQQQTNKITFLRQQLHQMSQQMNKLAKQKDYFQRQYQQNQNKYDFYLKTQNDLRIIMIKFWNNHLNNRFNNQLNENSEIIQQNYNLQNLKEKKVQNWTKYEIQKTVRILLNFLKPHFTMKNIKTQFIKQQKQNNLNCGANNTKPNSNDFKIYSSSKFDGRLNIRKFIQNQKNNRIFRKYKFQSDLLRFSSDDFNIIKADHHKLDKKKRYSLGQIQLLPKSLQYQVKMNKEKNHSKQFTAVNPTINQSESKSQSESQSQSPFYKLNLPEPGIKLRYEGNLKKVLKTKIREWGNKINPKQMYQIK